MKTTLGPIALAALGTGCASSAADAMRQDDDADEGVVEEA
jgi:hypothetical protein